MNLFDLSGKKAIVTGASRETGLCYAQAQALHEAGAEVVLLGGSEKNLEHMRQVNDQKQKTDVRRTRTKLGIFPAGPWKPGKTFG